MSTDLWHGHSHACPLCIADRIARKDSHFRRQRIREPLSMRACTVLLAGIVIAAGSLCGLLLSTAGRQFLGLVR